MADVHTIILVPAEGDPHGLLAETVGGGRPPQLWQCWGDKGPPRNGRWVSPLEYTESGSPLRGLLLAYAGEPVPMGLDRAWRRLRIAGRRQVLAGWSGIERTAQELVGRGRYAYYLAEKLDCSLIAVDVDGREVSL